MAIAEENLKSKAVKGVTWAFIGTSANKVIKFVISLILARMLTPSDYGLIGMLGFFIGLAETFIDSGFCSALIQYKDRTDRDLCTVFWVNLGMSFLMYGILYITAPLIAGFYNEPQLVNIIRVFCLTFLIGAFTAINSTKLTIELNYKKGTIINTISAIVSAIIGLGCAYNGFGVWALIAQQMSVSIVKLILYVYFARWFPKLIFSIESFKRLFGFGSKILVASLIHTAYSNLYPMIIGKQFKASDLGYVTRAQGFNDIIATNVTNVLGNVAFPLLSKVQDDNAKLLRAYEKYIKMSSFILFPLILFMCGVAKPMILFLLTDVWAPSIILLQILSFSYLWNGITQINLSLLYVKGRTDLVLKLEIIKKSIAFAIMIISILVGNLYVFCIGMTVYSFVALYLNTYYTKRLLNFGFWAQMRQIWPYLLFSLIVAFEGLIISELVSNSFLALVLASVVCIPTYILLCYNTRQFAFVEAIHIVSPKMGKLGRWLENKVN